MAQLADLDSRTCLFLGLARSIERSKAEREGMFYTPSTVAHRMVRHAFENRLEGGNALPRVLDPSCGAGVFLLEALLLLIERQKAAGLDSLERRIEIASESIFGMDKDSTALTKAKQLISTAINYDGSFYRPSNLNLRGNFACVNSLLLGDKKSAIEKVSGGLFDFVFGNPPYGLSRGNKISVHEKRRLKLVYGAQSRGKINKYLLFIVQGMHLLKPGGVLSYIVPNSWLGIEDGFQVRKLLFEGGALERLDIFHYKVFQGISVETVVVQAVKSGALKNYQVNHYYSADEQEARESYTIPYSHWQRSPNLQIPLTLKAKHRGLGAKVSRGCFRLGDSASPFEPRIALQAYSVGKGFPPQTKQQVKGHVFHSEHKQSKSCVKYLEGRDVRRFCYSWSGRYLKHGPWLAEPQAIERFCGARIMIREILAKQPHPIIACFIEEPALYNKSVLHILPKEPEQPELLRALVALLNSQPAGQVISIFGRKSQRNLFPKLLNSDLKNFPLPHGFFTAAPELAALSTEMSSLCRHADVESRPVIKLQAKIDNVVRRLYSLRKVDF